MRKNTKEMFNEKSAKEHYKNLLDFMIALRQECKLSQTSASYELRIDRAELSKYENGIVNIPLYRFADICITYCIFLREHHIELSERARKIEKLCSLF